MPTTNKRALIAQCREAHANLIWHWRNFGSTLKAYKRSRWRYDASHIENQEIRPRNLESRRRRKWSLLRWIVFRFRKARQRSWAFSIIRTEPVLFPSNPTRFGRYKLVQVVWIRLIPFLFRVAQKSSALSTITVSSYISLRSLCKPGEALDSGWSMEEVYLST